MDADRSAVYAKAVWPWLQGERSASDGPAGRTRVLAIVVAGVITAVAFAYPLGGLVLWLIARGTRGGASSDPPFAPLGNKDLKPHAARDVWRRG